MAYICKNCNFKFDARFVSDCPYCGKEDSIEKEKNASELLEEINGILSGFQ